MSTYMCLRVFLESLAVIVVVSVFFSCSMKTSNMLERKIIICYNQSPNEISVTSVTGIQAYARGGGPQNLGFGNLKQKGYAAYSSRGSLYIKYPITIKWVIGTLNDPRPDWPTSLTQEITQIYGVEKGRTEFSEEMSVILAFNGDEWNAYYAPKRIIVEDDIIALIESFRNKR